MDSWKCVVIKSAGEWAGCDYIGGTEQVTSIVTQPVSLENLRYNINNFLQGANLGLSYDLYYLSHSRSGGPKKSMLVTDEQLEQLFMRDTYPIVYVIQNNANAGVDTLQSDAYFPSFDVQERISFGYGSEFTQYDDNLEQIQRMASTDWLGERYIGDGNFATDSHRYEVNFGEPSCMAKETRDGLDHDNDDEDDDPDFVPAREELESDAEVSEDETEENLQKFTFAEFASWIQREGGMAKLLELVQPTGAEFENEEEGSLDGNEFNNWLVPVIPVYASDSLMVCEEDPSANDELAKGGAYYNSKEDLKIAIGLWHIEQGAEYTVDRSDKGRLVWRCIKKDKCPFKLRANSRGSAWCVSEFNSVHTCVLELDHVGPSKVEYKVITTFIAKKIRHECEILRPNAIMDELLQNYGVSIKYDQALKARHTAIEMIYGRYDDSYEMLPGYLHQLQVANPGSITELEVGEDRKFRHCFVALSGTRLAYAFCLRPVIVVDGTHLKGKSRGILFVAVTKDVNEGIYPLAYGVGPIENDELWTWFLSRVRSAYGCRPNTLIVSDAHVSIANAVKEVFPDATHALCYFHILKKLSRYGKFVGGLYQRAAYAYKHDSFKRRVASIREDKPAAYEKLTQIGPEKWAKSKCPVKRYSFHTSNAAEVCNSRLLWARCLPICALLEAIRHVMERWFDERRQSAQALGSPLSTEALRKINANKVRARGSNAVYLEGEQYRVSDGRYSNLVDLQARWCEYRQFDLDGLPCSHAITAIQKSGRSILNYVEPYYTRNALLEAYRHHISPVPRRNEWILPHDVRSTVCLRPIVVRQAGRPRLSRYRDPMEKAPASTSATGEPSSTRKRRPKRCSHCRELGYNRNLCPHRIPDENSN